MASMQVRIRRKVLEAQDIAGFELVRVDGRPMPAFSAGAHIDVHVPGGLVRQYSLLDNSQDPDCYRIAVLLDAHSRGGSVGMHVRVHEGDILSISEPRNLFPLERAARTVLVAGGIGITPLICMAHQLSARGADYELHYCTRSPSHTAFLAEIAGSAMRKHVHYHYDDGPVDQRLHLPNALNSSVDATHVYVCGPAGFIMLRQLPVDCNSSGVEVFS